MIRVLHISSEATWRGGEQQIAYLIANASNIRHFVLCRKGSAFEKYCIRHNIPCYAASFSPVKMPFTANELIRYCQQEKIDLVHCHTGKAHLLGYLAIKTGLEIPVVASRRIATRPSSSMLTRLRYDHPQVRRIICVSDNIRKTMSGYLKSPERAVTIHSGIDITPVAKPGFSLRENFNLPDSIPVIGIIAALTAEKDIPTFLRTAALIHKRGIQCHYFIAGDGRERPELEQLTGQLGIKDKVTFAGRVSNPLDYLQQFTIFLFTSKNEGLGTSILDAFLCKIPVVASRTGGIPEIVADKQTGLLADPGRADEFSQLAVSLLSEKDLRENLVRNASTSLPAFSSKVMAENTADCYRKVLEEWSADPTN